MDLGGEDRTVVVPDGVLDDDILVLLLVLGNEEIKGLRGEFP